MVLLCFLLCSIVSSCECMMNAERVKGEFLLQFLEQLERQKRDSFTPLLSLVNILCQ